MGGMTVKHAVWYPDLTDVDQPNVWAATMAQSVADGIGDRLELQEKAVGLKAGLSSQFTLTTTAQILPMVIKATDGSFKEGFDISGGIATVTVKGMYLISGALGIQPASGTTTAMGLWKGTSSIIGDEQVSSPTFYQGSKATTIVNCIPGDTLYMKGRCAANTVLTAAAQDLTHFTVAMIQAVP